MLDKLLNFSRHTPPPRPPATVQPRPEEKTCLALRIIHAGGHVECYYMAIPAGRVLEKYPGFVIARPEVFRRPWNSVVRPEKILIPGQKFYLVPRRTIKKLQRRIRKPDREVSKPSINAAINMGSSRNDEVLSKSYISDSSGASGSFTSALKKKNNGIKKHVRFVGIEGKQKGNANTLEKKKSSKQQEGISRKSLNAYKSPNPGNRSRNSGSWQPSLTSITERNDE